MEGRRLGSGCMLVFGFLTLAVLIALAFASCGDVDESTVISAFTKVDDTLEDGDLHGQGLFTVNVFYIVPADKQHQDDAEPVMREALTLAKAFYADEMARHGYGPRTFDIERDQHGEIIIGRHTLKRPAADYYADLQLLGNEIRYWEDAMPEHVQYAPNHHRYWNGMPTVFFIDLPGYHGRCGSGGGGDAWLYCWNWRTLAHELGHVLGLQHDFRSDAYMMSYGWERGQMSAGAAKWVNHHNALAFPGVVRHQIYKRNLLVADPMKAQLAYSYSYRGEGRSYVKEDTLLFDFAVFHNGSRSHGNLLGFTENVVLTGVEDISLSHDGTRHLQAAVYEVTLDGVAYPPDAEEVNIMLIGKFGDQAYGRALLPEMEANNNAPK